jgi:hypothetical protein
MSQSLGGWWTGAQLYEWIDPPDRSPAYYRLRFVGLSSELLFTVHAERVELVVCDEPRQWQI